MTRLADAKMSRGAGPGSKFGQLRVGAKVDLHELNDWFTDQLMSLPAPPCTPYDALPCPPALPTVWNFIAVSLSRLPTFMIFILTGPFDQLPPICHTSIITNTTTNRPTSYCWSVAALIFIHAFHRHCFTASTILYFGSNCLSPSPDFSNRPKLRGPLEPLLRLDGPLPTRISIAIHDHQPGFAWSCFHKVVLVPWSDLNPDRFCSSLLLSLRVVPPQLRASDDDNHGTTPSNPTCLNSFAASPPHNHLRTDTLLELDSFIFLVVLLVHFPSTPIVKPATNGPSVVAVGPLNSQSRQAWV